MKLLVGSAVMLAALSAMPAFGQTAIDMKKSRITAVFKQMSVPVEGQFQKFNVQMQFDPSKPETSQVRIDVDVKSFDIGDESYNKEVQGKNWFNAPVFPQAQFVSSGIKFISPGRYQVTGKLSVKGISNDVSFPVALSNEAGAQVFDGSLPMRRLQFNIGDQEWRDTSMVADDVQLKFHLVTAAR